MELKDFPIIFLLTNLTVIMFITEKSVFSVILKYSEFYSIDAFQKNICYKTKRSGCFFCRHKKTLVTSHNILLGFTVPTYWEN